MLFRSGAVQVFLGKIPEVLRPGGKAQQDGRCLLYTSIQMGEGGGRGRVGQVVGGNVDSLHRGNGTLAGGGDALLPVSYTHLDVYKRQHQYSGILSLISFANLSAARLLSALPPGI